MSAEQLFLVAVQMAEALGRCASQFPLMTAVHYAPRAWGAIDLETMTIIRDWSPDVFTEGPVWECEHGEPHPLLDVVSPALAAWQRLLENRGQQARDRETHPLRTAGWGGLMVSGSADAVLDSP